MATNRQHGCLSAAVRLRRGHRGSSDSAGGRSGCGVYASTWVRKHCATRQDKVRGRTGNAHVGEALSRARSHRQDRQKKGLDTALKLCILSIPGMGGAFNISQTDKRPIYLQIMEQIKQRITVGD